MKLQDDLCVPLPLKYFAFLKYSLSFILFHISDGNLFLFTYFINAFTNNFTLFIVF